LESVASKEDVACYRLYAANCVEMAARLTDPERKVFLLRMAQAWGNLADRIEKAVPVAGKDGLANPGCEASPAGT
jgi:hypothetical protein